MKKYLGDNKKKVAVFISGNGSNLLNIIKFSLTKKSPISVKLIISNKSIKLLLEQDESEVESEGESEGESKETSANIGQTAEDLTPADVSAFASLMEKIGKEQSNAVKQDLILYNLTKDMAYYNACITAMANLENIYANIVDALKDKNKTPENIESDINKIVGNIKESFDEKTLFYEECKNKLPKIDLLPESLKENININKDTDSLPKFDFDSSKLIKDLKENYSIEKFKNESRNPSENSIVLFNLPRNYLSSDEELDKFLNDDQAIKMVLNLYGRKNLVDSLLTGKNGLDKNIQEIDKYLNEMSEALDRLSGQRLFRHQTSLSMLVVKRFAI